MWDHLFDRQTRLLPGRVAPEFLDGLKRLDLTRPGVGLYGGQPFAGQGVVRLSLPAGPEHAEVLVRRGVVAEPSYGTQLQDMANPGVAPEGKVRVTYSSVPVRFADGTLVELRKPELDIDFGELPAPEDDGKRYLKVPINGL